LTDQRRPVLCSRPPPLRRLYGIELAQAQYEVEKGMFGGIGFRVALARLRIAAGVRGGRTVTDPPDSVGMENLERSRVGLAQLPCQLHKNGGQEGWWTKSGWWVRKIGQRLQKAVVRRLIIGRPQSRKQSPSVGTGGRAKRMYRQN
jgi:hypothetical protein